MGRGHRDQTFVMSAAFVVFAVCCVLPIAYLVATTFGFDGNTYRALALDSRQRGLLFNTAMLGTGTALLATALGAPLGIVLARVPLRFKGVIRVAAAAPILLPPYIVALAWTYIGTSRGLLAAIFVQSLTLYPLSMLTSEVAMRRVDGRLEEAALIAASPHRVLWRITTPLVAPAILAAALLVFVVAVSEFGVPGVLQVRVYTTEVFTAFASLYDFGRAIVVAIPLLLLCVAIAAIAGVLLGDHFITSRRTVGVSPMTFDRWRHVAIAALVVVVATALAMPVVTLVVEALGTRSIGVVAGGSTEAIVNSLILAAIGATVVVALALWLGYAQARAPRTVRLVGQVVLVVLFSVPSTIVGVGLIGLWNRPAPVGVYGTDAMFVLVYLARFVPVAVLILAATIQTISLSQEEAAAVSGAGWLRTFRVIVLPQLRVGIAAAWVVAFVLAFGELGASILVAPPGEATLPIRVYTIIANAPSSHVAALALVQALVIFTPVAMLGGYAAFREAT